MDEAGRDRDGIVDVGDGMDSGDGEMAHWKGRI
jgi:hypothetical protein